MLSIEGGHSRLYQWDVGQRLAVSSGAIVEVHFDNAAISPALVCEVYEENGKRYADIPNILLQQARPIRAYGCCDRRVRDMLICQVERRERPADYVYTETEVKNYDDLERRIEYLERHGTGGSGGAGSTGPISYNDLLDRPFYEYEAEVWPLSEVTFEDGEAMFETPIPLENGKTYRVVWNGTEYTVVCVPYSMPDADFSASILMTDAFMIMTVPEEYKEAFGGFASGMISMEGLERATVGIWTDAVKQLDEKYFGVSWDNLPGKPFGRFKNDVDVLLETVHETMNVWMWPVPLQSPIVTGRKYIVTLDGEEYEATATKATGGMFETLPNGVFLGNAYISDKTREDTGEPFLFIADSTGGPIYMEGSVAVYVLGYLNTTSSPNTFSIRGTGEYIVPISKEYFPEEIEAEVTAEGVKAALGYTPADAETVETLAGDVERLAGDVEKLTEGVSDIPEYWRSELESGINDIRSAMIEAGWNKSAFLWYNDAHWTANYQQSPKLLRYLYKHTAINRINFGGDIVESEAASTDSMEYLYDWREAIRDLPHHSVVGNHDDSVNDDRWTDEEVYAFLLAAEETPDIVRGDRFYYYIDSPAEKTRYLYLDTASKRGNVLNDPAQEDFFRGVLKSTPDGWHIVAISHIWLNVDYNVSPPTATGFSMGGKIMLDMFDAYNKREGSFAECKATVEFCIGGHSHVDADYTTPTGIPVILTECDSRNVRGQFTAEEGTTAENSVNAIIADYGNKKINVIRIGRGESRVVPINHSLAVSYTNQLPISIAEDGSVYNGKGYKEDTRINSSGVDAGEAGWCVTGYLPVKVGDVIRFKNMNFFLGTEDLTYPRSHFAFYGEDFSYLAKSDDYTPGNLPSSAWSPVYSENGDLIQATIPTSYGSVVKYIRITARELNEDSIITVNEEIQ